MEILPNNAADLLQDPDKIALRQIHAQIENSQEAGQAFHFAEEIPGPRRPDFLVGLADRAYVALQVATQPHRVRDGRLMLVPQEDGERPVLSPVGYVSVRSVGVGKDVKRSLGFRIYVMPVIVFLGEGPDNAVQAWGLQHGVRTLFGADRLMEQLVFIARESAGQIYRIPTMAEIRDVMEVFNDEVPPQAEPAPEVGQVPIPDMDLTARQVIIQHVDTVNVYAVGAGDDGANVAANTRDGRQLDQNPL